MAEVSGSRLVSTEEGLTTSVRIRSTENSSFLHTRHGATHEMQIGAADSAGGQTHNGVEIVFYRRLLDVVESNVSNSMVNDGFHSYSPEKSFWGFVARLGFRSLFAQLPRRAPLPGDFRGLLSESGASGFRQMSNGPFAFAGLGSFLDI